MRDYSVMSKLLDMEPDPQYNGFVDRLRDSYKKNTHKLSPISTDFDTLLSKLTDDFNENGLVDIPGMQEDIYYQLKILDYSSC